jgi:Squalene-hopene cyclase C-terminal domain
VVRRAGSLGDIGEIERTALLAGVAGLNPRRFGGRDLLDEIEGRRRANGSISNFVSYTAFGIMALRAGGASAGSQTIRWLAESQNSDGGFGVARASASDSDMTGAALQALATVGRANGAVARKAAGWLRDNQNDDGGYGQFKGRPSNAQSTSYAVQGLLAAGAGGGTVARARGYLVRLQQGNGSVAYSASSNQTPVWVTAQALMALEGKPLPLAAVPRKKRPRARSAENGSGGAAAGGAGGGKSGAADGGGAGGAVADVGDVAGVGAAGDPAGTGVPGVEPEGTTAETLLDTAAARTAAGNPKPVPLWAGILAAIGLVALLWALHRYVLPRRPDVN